jgi:glutaredoxin
MFFTQDMNFTIYSKEDCPYCHKVKTVLEKDNSSNLNINKNNHENRGIDFILNGGKRKQTQPFHIIFEKMVCFLKREVNVYFEFSLSVRKRH